MLGCFYRRKVPSQSTVAATYCRVRRFQQKGDSETMFIQSSIAWRELGEYDCSVNSALNVRRPYSYLVTTFNFRFEQHRTMRYVHILAIYVCVCMYM